MFAADDGARHRQLLNRQENDVEQGRRTGVRPAMVLAPAVGIALLAVACGSGSSPPAAAGDTAYRKSLVFAQCMRSHGQPGFPDPTSQGQLDFHANLHAAPFVRAWNACEHLLPNGGQVTAAQQRQAVSQALKLVACVRAHGLPAMRDPTVSAQGMVLSPPPGVRPSSPQFQAALKACGKFQPSGGS
jgi:hypothetical protein